VSKSNHKRGKCDLCGEGPPVIRFQVCSHDAKVLASIRKSIARFKKAAGL